MVIKYNWFILAAAFSSKSTSVVLAFSWLVSWKQHRDSCAAYFRLEIINNHML